MPKMFVMRKASGKLFKFQDKLIAVWAGEDALLRTTMHNPELDMYQPAIFEGDLAEELRKESSFWLVDAFSPDAKLNRGRVVDWQEINKLHSHQPPQPTLPPKVRAIVREFNFS
ncbi:MAG: hypothetical protein JNN15_20860 [Blastocatellia bacterium]|nr:hypothetical protein [Blastocatellia bacterium]